MDLKAMEPHGLALLDYYNGNNQAELTVRRDDGFVDSIPVSHFFRDVSEFTTIENAALEQCRGNVLDVGAGTGLHSLALQKKGLPVTAIDISPQAVKVMKRRRIKDARCANIFEFQGGPFETILLLGRSIGMGGTIGGADRFLAHARGLLSGAGQVLLDSLDVRTTDDPCHLAYHQINRKAGRYFGETRLQFEYQGKKGPCCDWLHIDADTLRKRAEAAGWGFEVILQEKSGDYLAKLVK